MSAKTPKFRSANLLLIASIVLVCTVAPTVPATALPADFAGSALRSIATWFGDIGRKVIPTDDPSPPDAGTCIDPNGKPRPCGVIHVPNRVRREAERPVPAV